MNEFQKNFKENLSIESILKGGPGSGGSREGAGRPSGSSNEPSGNEKEAINTTHDLLGQGHSENVILNKLIMYFPEISEYDLENIMNNVKSGNLKRQDMT
jgi:hypothetical protein